MGWQGVRGRAAARPRRRTRDARPQLNYTAAAVRASARGYAAAPASGAQTPPHSRHPSNDAQRMPANTAKARPGAHGLAGEKRKDRKSQMTSSPGPPTKRRERGLRPGGGVATWAETVSQGSPGRDVATEGLAVRSSSPSLVPAPTASTQISSFPGPGRGRIWAVKTVGFVPTVPPVGAENRKYLNPITAPALLRMTGIAWSSVSEM